MYLDDMFLLQARSMMHAPLEQDQLSRWEQSVRHDYNDQFNSAKENLDPVYKLPNPN